MLTALTIANTVFLAVSVLFLGRALMVSGIGPQPATEAEKLRVAMEIVMSDVADETARLAAMAFVVKALDVNDQTRQVMRDVVAVAQELQKEEHDSQGS